MAASTASDPSQKKEKRLIFPGAISANHLGKFEGRAIDKLHRSEITEFADLVIDRLGDLLPSITDMNGAGHPCDEVEITIPILVIDPDSFPSGDHGDSPFHLISRGPLQDEVGMSDPS